MNKFSSGKRLGTWQIMCALVFGTGIVGTFIDQSYRLVLAESGNNDVLYVSFFWAFVFMLFLVGFAVLLDRNEKEPLKKGGSSEIPPDFNVVSGYSIVEDEDGRIYRYDVNPDGLRIAIHRKTETKPYKWERMPNSLMLDFAKPGSTMHLFDIPFAGQP